MRHVWFSLALLAFAVPAPAPAQRADSSQTGDGSFGAKLLITDDLEGFWKQWEQPETPQISTTSRVDLSKKVYGMVVFFGCRAAANGNCKVTAHFEVTGPDGRPYGAPHAVEAWSGPPAPDHNLLASRASLGFMLEPKDKLGQYLIKVVLTDDVAKTSVTVSDYLTAVPVSSADAIPTS